MKKRNQIIRRLNKTRLFIRRDSPRNNDDDSDLQLRDPPRRIESEEENEDEEADEQRSEVFRKRFAVK